MRLSDFDYELPKGLIAQRPLDARDSSRLMIVDRSSGKILHDYFYNLLKYLRQDDLLVFNDTRVFPARLYGKKETGGKVEVLLLPHPLVPSPKLGEGNRNVFNFVGRNIGRAKRVIFDGNLEGKVVRPGVIKFNVDSDRLMKTINKIGHIPLPPYVTPEGRGERPKLVRRYNTVYAKENGSAAAPTKGAGVCRIYHKAVDK